MTNTNGNNNLQNGNDLNALGFVNSLAKQGIIKLIIALLCVIILGEGGVIIWQQRAYREDNVKMQERVNKEHELQQQFLMELLKEQSKTKYIVDTSYHP